MKVIKNVLQKLREQHFPSDTNMFDRGYVWAKQMIEEGNKNDAEAYTWRQSSAFDRGAAKALRESEEK